MHKDTSQIALTLYRCRATIVIHLHVAKSTQSCLNLTEKVAGSGRKHSDQWSNLFYPTTAHRLRPCLDGWMFLGIEIVTVFVRAATALVVHVIVTFLADRTARAFYVRTVHPTAAVFC